MRVGNFLSNFAAPLFAVVIFFSCSNKKPEIKEEKKVFDKKDFWVGDTTKHVHGIDVSHHQKEIDWKKVKDFGVTFVFVKATDGIDYLDSMFVYNWENLEKERMIKGAYHFFESDDDPEEQAEWFVKNVGSFTNALPPVVDVERAGHGDITVKEFRNKLIKCLNHIEKLTGKKPILYSCPNFAKKYLGSQEFEKYKPWIADYDVDQPTLPKLWENSGWLFWQNSFQDTVPGVPSEVDRNVFADKFHKLLEMID